MPLQPPVQPPPFRGEQDNDLNNIPATGGILASSRSDNNPQKIIIAVIFFIIVGLAAYGVKIKFFNKGSGAPAVKNDTAQISPTPTINPKLDSDGDDIPDLVEKAIGTNPNKMDSDGDSYNDLPELKSGYSPVVPGGAGKLTPEQLQALKDKIKTADEDFYNEVFGVEIKSVSGAEGFSTPEETFKTYRAAYETKNLDLYLKSLSKKSKDILDKEASFSTYKDTSTWDVETFKKEMDGTTYKVVEKTDKYAIMAPEVRELPNPNYGKQNQLIQSETVQMPDVYFEHESDGWKIDFSAIFADGFTRLMVDPKSRDQKINEFKDSWRKSFN